MKQLIAFILATSLALAEEPGGAASEGTVAATKNHWPALAVAAGVTAVVGVLIYVAMRRSNDLSSSSSSQSH